MLWEWQKKRTLLTWEWIKFSNYTQANKLRTLIDTTITTRMMKRLLRRKSICYVMFEPGKINTEYIGESLGAEIIFFSRRNEEISLRKNKRKRNLLSKAQKLLLNSSMDKLIILPFWASKMLEPTKYERRTNEQAAIAFYNPPINDTRSFSNLSSRRRENQIRKRYRTLCNECTLLKLKWCSKLCWIERNRDKKWSLTEFSRLRHGVTDESTSLDQTLIYLRKHSKYRNTIGIRKGNVIADRKYASAVWGCSKLIWDDQNYHLSQAIEILMRQDNGTIVKWKFTKILEDLLRASETKIKILINRKWAWKEKELYSMEPRRLDALIIRYKQIKIRYRKTSTLRILRIVARKKLNGMPIKYIPLTWGDNDTTFKDSIKKLKNILTKRSGLMSIQKEYYRNVIRIQKIELPRLRDVLENGTARIKRFKNYPDDCDDNCICLTGTTIARFKDYPEISKDIKQANGKDRCTIANRRFVTTCESMNSIAMMTRYLISRKKPYLTMKLKKQDKLDLSMVILRNEQGKEILRCAIKRLTAIRLMYKGIGDPMIVIRKLTLDKKIGWKKMLNRKIYEAIRDLDRTKRIIQHVTHPLALYIPHTGYTTENRYGYNFGSLGYPWDMEWKDTGLIITNRITLILTRKILETTEKTGEYIILMAPTNRRERLSGEMDEIFGEIRERIRIKKGNRKLFSNCLRALPMKTRCDYNVMLIGNNNKRARWAKRVIETIKNLTGTKKINQETIKKENNSPTRRKMENRKAELAILKELIQHEFEILELNEISKSQCHDLINKLINERNISIEPRRILLGEAMKLKKTLANHIVYCPDRNTGAFVIECPRAAWKRQKNSFIEKEVYNLDMRNSGDMLRETIDIYNKNFSNKFPRARSGDWAMGRANPKDKDLNKSRTIHAAMSLPWKKTARILGRVLTFLLEEAAELYPSFRLIYTKDLPGRLRNFEKHSMKKGHSYKIAQFDIKDMFNNLSPEIIISCVQEIFALVTRKRKRSRETKKYIIHIEKRINIHDAVISWTPMDDAWIITEEDLIKFVKLDLKYNMLTVRSWFLKQDFGCPIGGFLSCGYANILCTVYTIT